ncbi:MAG: VWA domain-containing protein [Caldilineales bacterium]|nr:VWA domain-containing protein [Caldilineales bacterium]
MSNSKQSTQTGRILIIALLGLAALCALCMLFFAMFGIFRDGGSTQTIDVGETVADPRSAVLTLAYSPEKAGLITPMVEEFNAQKLRTPDREAMEVRLVEMAPDLMVQEALGDSPGFQALSPDASLWLDQMDQRWAELHRQDAGDVAPRRIADSARYAVSPIVIAVWPEIADQLGANAGPIGWSELQQRAASDRNFRWSHASTSYASGMLATLAEFYAGAGKTRGLTEDDVLAQETLDYVRDIERTVSFYGENEATAMRRMAEEGRSFLDALIVQEALVVQHNRAGNDPLVAIYPHEGALWEDHPLALLDDPGVTDNQRRTFLAFSEFLRAPEQQKQILDLGYRPADLSIPIDFAGSPISPAYGANPAEPQTTLQMPGPSVIQVVQNAWQYTKRPSNIYLVVDTSGSMEGEKIENMRSALHAFVGGIQGVQDRVGFIEFAGSVYNIIPPESLDDAHRSALTNAIDALYAGGDTALLDGVRAAYVRLQRQPDPESINAIVVMTDGRENASSTDLGELVGDIRSGNESGVPVVIFAIAYGDDADYDMLNVLAQSSGGQVRQGDTDSIRELYRLLSQYF